MGFFDFISGLFGGGIPWQYRHIVSVFSSEVMMSESEDIAKYRLQNIAARLSSGTEQEQRAAKGLSAFIEKGGAKYFVKKK